MAARSTFTDMHLGCHHGWASVARMTGRGPALLLLPENGTCFEAWRSGREDAANAGPLWTPHLMVHSNSYQVPPRSLSFVWEHTSIPSEGSMLMSQSC